MLSTILSLTEGRCQKGYKEMTEEHRTYEEIYLDGITEQLQTDYLGRYESVQKEIHQVGKNDESSDVNTLCYYNGNM